MGMIPSILTTAVYEAKFPPHLRADNIPANPGAFDPANDDPTVWKDSRAAYVLYIKNLEAISSTWARYISDELMQPLMDPEFGLAAVSLADQYTHVSTIYGTLPFDYLPAMFRALDQPHPLEPASAIITKLQAYFRMRLQVNAGIHEIDKLAMLYKCFNFAPYTVVMEEYFRQTPLIPQVPAQPGMQTYAALLLIVEQVSRRLQLTTLPSQHQTLAGQATGAANSVTKDKPREDKPKLKGDWCWGHGHTYHAGTECHKPLPGHRKEATKSNRMGGADYTWTKLSQAQRAAVIKDGPASYRA